MGFFEKVGNIVTRSQPFDDAFLNPGFELPLINGGGVFRVRPPGQTNADGRLALMQQARRGDQLADPLVPEHP